MAQRDHQHLDAPPRLLPLLGAHRLAPRPVLPPGRTPHRPPLLAHLQGRRERIQQHRRRPLRGGVVDAGEPGAGGGGGGADDEVAILRVPGGGHVLPDEQLRVPPAVVPLAPPQPLPHPPRLHRHRRHDRRLLLPAHLLHLPVRPGLAARIPLRHHPRRRRHRLRAHVAPPQRRQVPRPPRAALRRDGLVGGRPRRARRRRQLARAAPERHAGVRGRHGRVIPRRHRLLPHPRARALEARHVRPLRPEPPDLPPARHRRRARPLRRRHRLPQGPRRDGMPGQVIDCLHQHHGSIVHSGNKFLVVNGDSGWSLHRPSAEMMNRTRLLASIKMAFIVRENACR